MPLPLLNPIPPEIAAVADYEPFARERLSAGAWAYYAGGVADEVTLRRNREAFDTLLLQGRALVDLPGLDTRTTLFGQEHEAPILLAPVAYQKMAHPDGELATVLGASAIRTGMIVSTEASTPLEEIARHAHAPLWFQLYFQPDRHVTADLVRRAEAAGYRALVVTVDAPVNGPRNRQQRAGFGLPPGVGAANLAGYPPAPVAESLESLLAFAPTWKDVAWLRSLTSLPILLKGVLSPDDAELAVREGVSGLVVSNHGGRTLDTLPATIEALPRIADRIAGRIPLLLDGGIRRGTDIVKALALGANAVLIGRPYLFALAAAGPSGVAHVVNLLRTELAMAMALTGCARIADITPSVLWKK